MHYAFQSPDRLYFVLDYVNGGDLFYHLKKKNHFSEKEARFYGAELFLALEYLHKSGFIYRDMKPENILLD
jgi:serine/threonine protein kinase